MKRSLATLIGVMLAIGWVWYALDRLAAAQTRQAEAAVAMAPPAVVAARSLPTASDGAARPMVAKLLGDAAAAAGVRLSLTPVAPRLEGLTVTRIEAHGDEERLRAFALAVEGPGSPLRLVSWSIDSDGTGSLRLTAEAAAPRRSPARADAVQLGDAPPAPPSPARTLFAIDQAQDARPIGDAPPELVGIAGRLPNDAVALVRLPDGATRDLRIGESANGWRLTSLAADRAGFAKGNQQRDVVLPARE